MTATDSADVLTDQFKQFTSAIGNNLPLRDWPYWHEAIYGSIAFILLIVLFWYWFNFWR